MGWAKTLLMNFCDIFLIDRIDKKFDELDLYKQGGVTYLKILLDEMFTTCNTVIPALQGFSQAFAKEGISKVPNEDVCSGIVFLYGLTPFWSDFIDYVKCVQGWHQDMARNLTETIVINLGSEVDDDELKTGKILLVPGEGLHAINSSESEEEDIEDSSFVQGAVTHWSDAMM
jgi:hypothetical protein